MYVRVVGREVAQLIKRLALRRDAPERMAGLRLLAVLAPRREILRASMLQCRLFPLASRLYYSSGHSKINDLITIKCARGTGRLVHMAYMAVSSARRCMI